MSASTTKWETEVVKAWGREPDCAPSTGMCDACGLGAVVVEVDDNWETSVRSIMVGPDGKEAPFDYNTMTFEIASYTKHFTALAMVFLENQIDAFASTTIGQWLPCDWDEAASPLVGNITLQELRLHTSGLPPQAPNHDLAGGDGNPFAGYTETMLCDSLLKLTGLPSQGRFVYSNYAYGILGYALTIVAGKLAGSSTPPSYQDLVNETVLAPLNMKHTSVTLDEAGWANAAVGCDRDLLRGNYAIRRGEYGVFQGNGALRSTLPDMGEFLKVSLLVDGGYFENNTESLTPMQKICYEAVRVLNDRRQDQKEACTCVSGWCEGNLCPLPNPVKEKVTDSGVTKYTSGGVPGNRKSGDTEGYSVRGAWSHEKRRAVFVVETCGGCGERGTSGSAAQRVALLLADGPPTAPSEPLECDEDQKQGSRKDIRRFTGIADSHIYPSFVDLEVEVRSQPGGTATISVASSDGAGCTATARAVEDGWEFDTSVLYGCGYGGDDPLASVPQKRSLRLKANGNEAVLQEMGEDIYLKATDVSYLYRLSTGRELMEEFYLMIFSFVVCISIFTVVKGWH